MLLVDTVAGRLIGDDELKETYARRQPYGEWLDQNLVYLSELSIPNKGVASHTQEQRDRLYKAFGYTYEDVKTAILPMAQNGAEPTSCHGYRHPPGGAQREPPAPVQLFQAALRPGHQSRPSTPSGRRWSPIPPSMWAPTATCCEEGQDNCRALQIENPILTSVDLLKIKSMNKPGFQVETVSMLYYKNTPLKRALDQLFVACDKAYRNGANIIILSDRGVDENHVAIPSLLAVSAMERLPDPHQEAHRRLPDSGVRASPGTCTTLPPCWATAPRAINPYLAQECIGELIEEGLLDKDFNAAVNDYNKAISDGIVKIASKMGISTLQSYQGAQIFEAIGINKDVVDQYFTNTVTRVGGIGLKEIEEIVDQQPQQGL